MTGRKDSFVRPSFRVRRTRLTIDRITLHNAVCIKRSPQLAAGSVEINSCYIATDRVRDNTERAAGTLIDRVWQIQHQLIRWHADSLSWHVAQSSIEKSVVMINSVITQFSDSRIINKLHRENLIFLFPLTEKRMY